MSDDLVWMSAARSGLAFHEVPAGERRTTCGRFFGDIVDGTPARGLLLPESEATTQYAAKHCVGCYEPDRAVKPRVSRRGGPTGAHR